MKFQFCSCFKRNHASYNLSSETISYTNRTSAITTVTSPPCPLSNLPTKHINQNISESSDNRQVDTNKDHLISPLSTNITTRQLSQVPSENDTELYAIVDKTKQAKNSIRIQTNPYFPSATTTGSRQLIHFQNTRISERRSHSLPPLNNTSNNTRNHSYECVTDVQYTSDDHLKPSKSFVHPNENFKTKTNQLRPHSFVYGQRQTNHDSHLYTEISYADLLDTLNRKDRTYSSTSPELNNHNSDTVSVTYATIEEPDIKKTTAKKHFLRRH